MLCCRHLEILNNLLTTALTSVFHWALQTAAGLALALLSLQLCNPICKTRTRPPGKMMEGLDETIQTRPSL